MQDKSGEEMLELRAQRDFHQETLRDSNEEVGRNQTVRVNGGQSTSAGSISISSGSTFTASAATDMTLTAGGTLKAEGTTAIFHGKGAAAVVGDGVLLLHGGQVHVSAGTMITITAPQVMIKSGHVTITGDASVDVNGGVVNLNC